VPVSRAGDETLSLPRSVSGLAAICRGRGEQAGDLADGLVKQLLVAFGRGVVGIGLVLFIFGFGLLDINQVKILGHHLIFEGLAPSLLQLLFAFAEFELVVVNLEGLLFVDVESFGDNLVNKLLDKGDPLLQHLLGNHRKLDNAVFHLVIEFVAVCLERLDILLHVEAFSRVNLLEVEVKGDFGQRVIDRLLRIVVVAKLFAYHVGEKLCLVSLEIVALAADGGMRAPKLAEDKEYRQNYA